MKQGEKPKLSRSGTRWFHWCPALNVTRTMTTAARRCPKCGEVSPDEQERVDRAAAKALRAKGDGDGDRRS